MALKFCASCCMDGSDPDLVLDEAGVCNHCHSAQRMLREIEADKHLLPEVIKQIKQDGASSDYDVLIGLSGGVDSSTVLHNAVELGLRPLCFSIDNGYNNPLADENIMRLVETLKVPFYRYTIDLPKFKDLQVAFIQAGVPNLEIPTDHILMASTLELASKYNIKWILSGGNVATESIMPASWGYNARDLRHIKDIYRHPLTGLPTCGLLKWNYYRWVRGIQTVYLLDFLDYNLEASKALLKEKYGWQDYYAKHCESYFTWWFQFYYLYEKFGFDKRKPHYASLINSGQMTRKEAFDLLADKPEYPAIGLESKIWKYPKTSHYEFKTDETLWLFLGRLIRQLKKLSPR